MTLIAKIIFFPSLNRSDFYSGAPTRNFTGFELKAVLFKNTFRLYYKNFLLSIEYPILMYVFLSNTVIGSII